MWLGQRGSMAGASREVMGQVMNLEPTLTPSPRHCLPTTPAAEEEAHRQRHQDHHLPGFRAAAHPQEHPPPTFSMSSSLSGPTTPALTTSQVHAASLHAQGVRKAGFQQPGSMGVGGEGTAEVSRQRRPRFLSVLQ